MKVTILNITRRTGGFDVLEDNLKRQTILPDLIASNDVELLCVDEITGRKRDRAFSMLCKEVGLLNWRHIYPPDYDPPRWGKLCRANNTGLKNAHGDYIFFLNDYLWIPDNCLEKMLKASEETPFPLLITCPNDRTNVPPKSVCRDLSRNTEYSIYASKFSGRLWNFPNVECWYTDARVRESSEADYHRNPIEWEACVAMAPTKLLRDAGGWNEELDYGYAQDNIDVANRALILDQSARVYLMREMYTVSISHQQYWDDPADMAEACERNRRKVEPTLEIIQKLRKIQGLPALPFTEGLDDGNGWHPVRSAAAVFDPNWQEPIVVKSKTMSIIFWMPDIGSWQPINPLTPFANALGGRETACVRLAQELAKLGCTVGVVTKTTASTTIQYEEIDWIPVDGFNKRFIADYDVLVSMENADIFRRVRARELNILHYQCTYPQTPVGDLDKHIDHYFLISRYQQFTLRSQDPMINPDKCVVFGNGVDLERYDSLNVKKKPGRMVWSSAPDRGLMHILRWWPRLKAEFPELNLRVFYDIEKNLGPWAWTMQLQAEWYHQCREGVLQPGIQYMGPVDQKLLARFQKESEVFLYPCDPSAPTETFCITALENAAAGVPMILSTADCLQEIYGGKRDCAWFLPVPIMDSDWIGAFSELYRDKDRLHQNDASARSVAEMFTWKNIAKSWYEFLKTRATLDNSDNINDLIDDTEYALGGYGAVPVS
jgi:glycosyltransferase involved in cell wall biosynthesis